MQKSGLEWVHRLLSQPRRLASRYAKDAVYFPLLLARDLLSGDSE
jgi:N-acetylglucosaminyldiphosphoundecaprenol N-acetyl-beta-D-mannosaminyltransferase